MVIVNRSLAAAKAISAGNSSSRARSRIMASSLLRTLANLDGRNEQSGNGGKIYSAPAIRTANAASARTSATQTMPAGLRNTEASDEDCGCARIRGVGLVMGGALSGERRLGDDRRTHSIQ
jgi:hypothetical protein